MKKRIYVVGLAVLCVACGNMFAAVGETKPAWAQKHRPEWTQKDAEEYFRHEYKRGTDFSRETDMMDLQNAWTRVADDLRNMVMRLSAQFTELPVKALYDEAIKYITELYNQQVKRIESLQMPVAPWEQQQKQP